LTSRVAVSSQEGLCSMELVGCLVCWLVSLSVSQPVSEVKRWLAARCPGPEHAHYPRSQFRSINVL